ncbi:MarR family transcriptional regulator [Actinocatenispora thailandica]
MERYRERLASMFMSLGIQRMPSRVFAALFVDESGRMTAGEIAAALQVSAAAVSGAIRYLTGVGMVLRERDPGSRRDHYVVTNTLWQQAIAAREPTMKRMEDAMREGVQLVGPDSRAGRRATETADFFEFLRSEMAGLMKRWEEHRAALHST